MGKGEWGKREWRDRVSKWGEKGGLRQGKWGARGKESERVKIRRESAEKGTLCRKYIIKSSKSISIIYI